MSVSTPKFFFLNAPKTIRLNTLNGDGMMKRPVSSQLSRICLSAVTGTLLLSSCLLAQAADSYRNGFPADPGFFPIGVWLQSPSRAANYKAIGINTFVGLWKGPTEPQLEELARQNMFVVAAQNDVGLNSRNRHVIKAWLHHDEPDNAQPIGQGQYGTCIAATEVVRQTREMKARDATRPIMINFGQGLANEFWPGRGPCSGDQKYYGVAAEGAGILSFDIYPVSSKTPQVKGKLEYVARGVARLKKIANEQQAVWTVIETTSLNPPHRVMPDQLRAEVWMALIHGAKGIVYFAHEFAPAFREDGMFRYNDITDEIKRTSDLLNKLAPILNSPDVAGKLTISASAPIATMVKLHENVLYIFAVAMTNAASSPRISIAGVSSGRAEVIGENRKISISQGVLGDSFEGYGVHLYAIPL